MDESTSIVGEIAPLPSRLHELVDDHNSDTAEHARILADKADHLARIADAYAAGWTCEHTNHARQIANDALAVAHQARAFSDRNTTLEE